MKAFIACMKQKGRFCHHHVTTTTSPIHDKTLLNFQNRGLLQAVGKDPKVYIVPHLVAEDFKKKYPDIHVQYIKSKVHETRKHGVPAVRFTTEKRNPNQI